MGITMSKKHREELLPELLPGIPDEITFDHISTKLPWSTVCVLSLVSRSWKQSIRTRQVHNARVHSNSTETFVVVCEEAYPRTNPELIKLFSVREKSFYPLPPLPSLPGYPHIRSIAGSNCIALDGRIYVIGGLDLEEKASAKVFALDVAGQRQWEQCASMLEPRDHFGCGVFDRKIYVFGGYKSYSNRAFGSEVYDPKTNVWSPITPMLTLRSFHQVAVVGKELLVYNGRVEDREFVNGVPQRPPPTDKFLEFYNPVTKNWRVSTPLRRSKWDCEWTGITFTANGNFCSMDNDGSSIRVYNFDTDSWTYLQANVFPVHGDHGDFSPIAIQALNGELVTIGSWRDEPGHAKSHCLLKSTGFGVGKYKAIKWEVEPESHCITYGGPAICLMEL